MTTATNHTPGPWRVIKKKNRVGYADYEVAWSDDGELVCDIVYHEGDANLIASAPDLLAALQACYDMIAEECADGEYTNQAAMARAAIARATGAA